MMTLRGSRSPAGGRRSTSRVVVVAALALLAPLVSLCGPAPFADASTAASLANAAAPLATRPNVVVIMTDDQTVQQLDVMTKTKQLLGDLGTTFSTSYTNYAECCPSRATFLTGQYSHNHGVVSSGPPTGGYNALDHANTLPVWLQNNGYYTALTGKYLNGYGYHSNAADIPPGWNDWWGLVDPSTYSYWGYTIQQNGTQRTYGLTNADYQTNVLGNHVTDLIRSRAGNPQPFFIWYTPIAPHFGKHHPDSTYYVFPYPEAAHYQKFKGRPVPHTPTFNNPGVGKPSFITSRPTLTATQTAGMDAVNNMGRETLLSVDDQVANIVQSLQDTGKLDNTVILFTSDNGYFMGEWKIQLAKTYPYDTATRVPLIVRGPGFPAGVVRNQLVTNADLAPTIVELTGTTPGRDMDGRSLQPVAADPTVGTARAVQIESGPLGERPVYYGVRESDPARGRETKFVQWNDGFKELYDLRADPYELKNLAYDPKYGLLRLRLGTKARELQVCAGATCRSG